jgi:hypothetical protein
LPTEDVEVKNIELQKKDEVSLFYYDFSFSCNRLCGYFIFQGDTLDISPQAYNTMVDSTNNDW